MFTKWENKLGEKLNYTNFGPVDNGALDISLVASGPVAYYEPYELDTAEFMGRVEIGISGFYVRLI